ncbi:MAG: mandelate racemase/muconate lactonizing enzyme family protein [Alsobacter sp.]
MRIEAVDLFYLSMPDVTTEADGSQDALLVRVRAGGYEGFGECEASPLTCIAAFVTPMSHGVCRSVGSSVLGRPIDGPGDIAAISADVGYNSMDLLQAPHMLSGVEMALWDLLGKARGEPVWKLLGTPAAHAKTPYASLLFGDTPQATLDNCRAMRSRGFMAVKLGWGPFGRGSLQADADQLVAAREGLGADATLLVDAGQIWNEDVEAAAARLPVLEQVKATWIEEPFHAAALEAYGRLSARSTVVRTAGGEGAHNVSMAQQLIDYGKVGFIQIDCGRIGGIGPAKVVADYAAARSVTYVNHTFTSHLALSASLQPYAGLRDHRICEYPAAPKPLAPAITTNHLVPDPNGEIRVPETPGLGMDVNIAGLREYLVDAELRVAGKVIYKTPQL